MFSLFSKNNNRIIIYKNDGTEKVVPFVFGLFIKFKGKNSTIKIHESCKFKFQVGSKRSIIKILGDNNTIILNSKDKGFYKSIRINNLGSNNIVEIGKNLIISDGFSVEFAHQNNLKLEIGDNCMFGQNVKFLMGDYHYIYDIETEEVLNIPQRGITIGNHVWLARNVTLLKDSTVLDDSVVAYNSVVTKCFDKTNVLLAGLPAKIVKENINWKK